MAPEISENRRTRPTLRKYQARDDGFTLIEVLVALVILGASLGVIFVGLSNSIREVQTAQRNSEAMAVVRSLLAAEGTVLPLRYGETGGTTADGYLWKIVTTQWVNDAYEQTHIAGAYLVKITVSRDHSSISLSTLRADKVPDAN